MSRAQNTFTKPKKALSIVVLTSVVTIGVLTLGSLIEGPWVCDMLTQFRLAYLYVLLVLSILSVAVRAWKVLLLCAVVALINAIPLVGLLFSSRCRQQTQSHTAVSILNFNTEFQHNNNYASLINLVSKDRPDIIALVEVDQKWIDSLQDLNTSYPYRRVAIEGAGMALFSRFPFEKIEVRHFGHSHHPRIEACISKDGTPINLLLAHPTTPMNAARFHERNEEISMIATELSTMTEPKFLIGDLNCGPWSSNFRNLLTVSGLHDSAQGFGILPTWPARTGRVLEGVPIPPLVPIDHVLVSKDVCVTDRIVGPPMNSDHLPVFVRAEFSDKK